MRLVRGAGATALAGMAPRGPGRFVRPLLALERRELRAYLDRHAVAYRDDPSNLDTDHDRNRVRLVVLPLLNRALNPRAARHLVRAADAFRQDALYLDGLAGRQLAGLSRREGRGGLSLEAGRLSDLDPVLASRVARLALVRAGIDPRRVASRHIDAVLDLGRGRAGRRIDLPSGGRARRRGPRVLIEGGSQGGT
jgi:tRNA(Ile)-lysidine synthase